MSQLRDLPVGEQIKALREIKEVLTQLIYTHLLPEQTFEQQVETLRMLDGIERRDMLTDVLSEAEAILS